MLFDTFTYPPKELVVLINWFKDQGLNLSTAEILPFAKFQYRLGVVRRGLAEKYANTDTSGSRILTLHRMFQEALFNFLFLEQVKRKCIINQHLNLRVDSVLLEFLVKDPYSESIQGLPITLDLELDLDAIFKYLDVGMELRDIFFTQNIFLASSQDNCDQSYDFDNLCNWIFARLPADLSEREVDSPDEPRELVNPQHIIQALDTFEMSHIPYDIMQLYRGTAALHITNRGLKEKRLSWDRVDQRHAIELYLESYLIYSPKPENENYPDITKSTVELLTYFEEALLGEIKLLTDKLNLIRIFIKSYDQEITNPDIQFSPMSMGFKMDGLLLSYKQYKHQRILHKMLLRALHRNYPYLRTWTAAWLRRH